MSDLQTATDEDLRALSAEERRELMARLARMSPGRRGVHMDPHRIRRNRIGFVTLVALGMIPWTIYLGATLPGRYVVRDWTLAWTGFDVALAVLIGSTALLALLRRQIVVLAAFGSAVLLLGDAWFDVTTSSGSDRATALWFAGFLEVPFAAFLLFSTFELLRLSSDAVYPRQGTPLWRMPLNPLS